MFDPTRVYKAGAVENGDFLCVETFSGSTGSALDPEGVRYLLPSTASDHEIGASVLDALSKSRLLSLDEDKIFFNLDELEKRYEIWVKLLMDTYGYKTRKALFKNMKSCSISVREGMIEIPPSRHEKLEAWTGTGNKGSDRVRIPVSSTPEEVGAALRLAFSRCK